MSGVPEAGGLALRDLVTGRAAGADGYFRFPVDAETWSRLCDGCAGGLQDLQALWADGGTMYLALGDTGQTLRAIVSLATDSGRYPSVASRHRPALRLERAMHDLYGVEPVGLPDPRPWLDHGRWPGRQHDEPYAFLAVKGEGVH